MGNLIVNLKPEDLNGANVHKEVSEWLDNMPEGKTANWVLGNHDNWRLRSRFGEGNIDGFNMMSLMLPGVAVTYNGEEIGMTNTDISWEDTVDPAGLNCGQEHFMDMGCSRDADSHLSVYKQVSQLRKSHQFTKTVLSFSDTVF